MGTNRPLKKREKEKKIKKAISSLPICRKIKGYL
jgi:hypothetical protein